MTDQEIQETFLNINRLIKEEGNGQVWRVARQLDKAEYNKLKLNQKEIYFYLEYCEKEKDKFGNIFLDLKRFNPLPKGE